MAIMRSAATGGKIVTDNKPPNREPKTPDGDMSKPKDAGMAIDAPMKK